MPNPESMPYTIFCTFRSHERVKRKVTLRLLLLATSEFMVTGDNFSDGSFKTRPVLTDVTNNQPARKRAFSFISSDEDSQFAKQVCLGVENLVKEKCQSQSRVDDAIVDSKYKDKVSLGPKGKSPCVMFPESSFGIGEKGQGTLTEGFNNSTCESDEWNLAVDKLASSKCESVERSTLQGSKFLGLERCVGLNSDGVDLLKACSCSFCSKAAYIWSDLHYQDVKGRLSVLKKSHKEASMMAQKFSAAKLTVINNQQKCTESSKLELYLMNQWKSLFVHVENTFAHESSQLESSFETLKDLRESCKNGLELIDQPF